MKVVLIGNYALDAQESMQRYAHMLHEGLAQAGCDVRLVAPRPVLNPGRPARGLWKWVGYVDKYLLGTKEIRQAVSAADIVHVCDHSNAVYVPRAPSVPYVVTCHDLLAVRGALGEDTDCPASAAGRQLQHAILRGLHRAQAVVCVSQATLRDAQRLLRNGSQRLLVVPNAQHYPYRPLDADEARGRLSHITSLSGDSLYLLHVGENHRRKNREAVLETFARIASGWQGVLVFAGHPLSGGLRELAGRLGVMGRVVEVVKPTNEVLEALYSRAFALLFPSRFEGFGWPVIEAQACGCPVLCSSREPLPEVSGGAAITCEADDTRAFGEWILRLAGSPDLRTDLVRRGLANAARHDRATMVRQFMLLYGQLTRRT
jgi:glycosyltransferase involved in cell wall biosynthesis